MVATFGISHIAMKVADLDRSVAFYEASFGAKSHHRDGSCAMLLGPGPADLMVFELDPEGAGASGGIQHFGFRLTAADQFEAALQRVIAAGGVLQERGDRGENQPFAFVLDPDGYEIELWHMNEPLHAQD